MRRNAVLAAALVLAAAAPATAQDEGAPMEVSLEEATALLSAESPSQVRHGLESLGLLGRPEAVGPIAARVRRGLPPDLLEVAIETLGILGQAEAGPILFRLLDHRRPAVRLSAVRAVGATGAPGADRALIAALSDSDAAVRGAAAEALGALGATSAVDALFQAMERHVPEAPTALGQIARPQDVERLLGYLGQVSFDALTPALSELLHRSNLADSARVAVVHRVSELATPGARQLLEDFVASSDDQSGGAARRAAIAAIPQMGQ